MKTDSAPSRAYRGESITKRRSTRRRQLINAGLRVIGEKGYSHSTVKAICQTAALTERYFYESFANREQLLAAVYQEQIDAIQWQMIAAAEAAEQSPEQLIRGALSAFFSTLLEKPATARLILFDILGVSDATDRLYYETMESFAELARNLSLSVGAEDVASPADATTVYAGLIGAVVQIGRCWYLGGYRENADTIIESAVILFLSVSRR